MGCEQDLESKQGTFEGHLGVPANRAWDKFSRGAENLQFQTKSFY